MFAVYAPANITQEAVHSHLKDIESYIKAFSPQANTEFIDVFEAI